MKPNTTQDNTAREILENIWNMAIARGSGSDLNSGSIDQALKELLDLFEGASEDMLLVASEEYKKLYSDIPEKAVTVDRIKKLLEAE